MRCALLLVGDELLSGKVRERNLQPLAQLLRARGHSLSRVVVVPDQLEEVAREVRALAADFDAVFTSGGIGPTHDDVTVAAVARAFAVELERDPRFEAAIHRKHGEHTRPSHLRMADVPRGAELVLDEEAQRSWPLVRMRNVWLLAGVPEVFQMQLAQISPRLPKLPGFFQTQVFVQLDEGQLAPWLSQVAAEFTDVAIGSYPKWFEPGYKVQLIFDGRDAQRVHAAAARFLSFLPPGEPQRVISDGSTERSI